MFKMFVNSVQIVTTKDGALAKKTQERREQLRRSLIEIAERRIAEKGYPALTARDVAGEAGCAVGAIYNIFPDMDALVAAVNSRTVARLEGRSRQPSRAILRAHCPSAR